MEGDGGFKNLSERIAMLRRAEMLYDGIQREKLS